MKDVPKCDMRSTTVIGIETQYRISADCTFALRSVNGLLKKLSDRTGEKSGAAVAALKIQV
jgi:hypothetical protein